MRKIKTIIRKMGLFIGVFILIFLIVVGTFLYTSPEFGGAATKEQKARYAASKNYENGVFMNMDGVKMSMGLNDVLKGIRGYFGPQPKTRPVKNVDVQKIDSLDIATYNGRTRLFWMGHSTFLMQIKDLHILIDPMFGPVPAPSPILGQKRFSKNLPIAIEKLPRINAVLLSHDHYDHLDYGSIQLLKNKVDMFYTPLGVGAHLVAWGVPKKRIKELDWWDEIAYKGLVFKCAPAQHFSGRGLMDRGRTLWSSWVITSDTENLFFSGDSGYGAHFKEIGEKYGPFDFAMMECGQYNELRKEIHMMPEETVQASLDVGAAKVMPIHWGAFKLAMHPWVEPVERFSKKATNMGVPFILPMIGEPIYLAKKDLSNDQWWRTFN